jgi:hypothetical protein
VADRFWNCQADVADDLERFGGFVAFGFLGLFIGPTLIAITFTSRHGAPRSLITWSQT